MALTEFTSKKGREITSWTPETVQEQIEAIDARYGKRISTNLQFALMSIYRHASEIAHGTFFGALFALGLTSPSGSPKSPEELQNHQRQNLSMLLMMLGLATSAFIMVLAIEIPSLSNLVIESEKVIKELQNDTVSLKQFGLLKFLEKLKIDDQNDGFELLAFFSAAKNAGLLRLINNDVFRDIMPDSNYSTSGEYSYVDEKLINITL